MAILSRCKLCCNSADSIGFWRLRHSWMLAIYPSGCWRFQSAKGLVQPTHVLRCCAFSWSSTNVRTVLTRKTFTQLRGSPPPKAGRENRCKGESDTHQLRTDFWQIVINHRRQKVSYWQEKICPTTSTQNFHEFRVTTDIHSHDPAQAWQKTDIRLKPNSAEFMWYSINWTWHWLTSVGHKTRSILCLAERVSLWDIKHDETTGW